MPDGQPGELSGGGNAWTGLFKRGDIARLESGDLIRQDERVEFIYLFLLIEPAAVLFAERSADDGAQRQNEAQPDDDGGFSEPHYCQKDSRHGSAAAESDSPRAVFIEVTHEPEQLAGGDEGRGSLGHCVKKSV